MAQAPSHVQSQHNAPKATPPGSTISLTQERAKQELFQAIESQNERFGGWQKTVKDWYKEKVEKFKKRGNDDKKAQELASKQIQRVRTEVYKDKMVTPGTKQGTFYKKEGDSDGEGSIFLLKKFVFGKKQTSVHYPGHEEIEKNGQSENLKDKNVIKLFLDGGGVPGVTVKSGETKGLNSAWNKTKMVVDHHPEGPTSTTGMVGKMLELVHLIPAAEKKTVDKFVLTIDVADSFLSRAGRTLDVGKDYAKTLVSFSYQLESDELYKLCSKLPDNVGPLTPLSDEQLNTIEVTMKGKKDAVKLSECVAKKQANIKTGMEMLDERIKQKQFVTIEGKKFLILGSKDNSNKDVIALGSASKDFGTIKVHETGDMFIVHDAGIPKSLEAVSHIIRDVLMVVNPNTTNNDVKGAAKKLCDLLPDSEGKKYLLALLGVKEKETKETVKEAIKETLQEAKEVKEIVKQPDTFVQKVAASPVVAPEPPVKREQKPRNLPKFDMSETKKDFQSIGATLGELRNGVKKWFRRGKK